jgi:hypothetical protein
MAFACIHLHVEDTLDARVSVCGASSYITVNISKGNCLFLPEGIASVNIARDLAAVLLTAADEQEARLSRALTADEATQALGSFVAQKGGGA